MQERARIGLIGDIMLGDQPLRTGYGIYSELHGDYTAVFSEFDEYATRFDFVIGNFEGVLVDDIGKTAPPGTLGMPIPRTAIECLVRSKVRYLSIANNHTMEFGHEQFRTMCQMFSESGIQTFGHKEKPYIIAESKGQRIGILSFSTVPAFYGFKPEYYFVDPDREDATNGLSAWVREARAGCDYLIVYPHWGCEFVPYASASQIALARIAIAAGADLIAGAHPHVIQNACCINGKPVLFSLGNFVCDYWQSRLRESIACTLEVGAEHGIQLHKLISGQDYVVRYVGESPPPAASEPDTTPPSEYANIVQRGRSRVRRETLLFLVRRIGTVLRNPTLLRWILRRVVFLIKNRRSIKSDPLKVYSQK